MKYGDLYIYESEFIDIKEIIEKMDYKKREWFVYDLNPSYFRSLFYRVEESDKLMAIARANYSASFCTKLKDYCIDSIRAYLWDSYIRENYAVLNTKFKRYGNDPNGLEWTPENIDAYLWDYYNKVDRNPWDNTPRKYTPDWFNNFARHYDAFMKVWGKYVNAGTSEHIKTAVKMEIIKACRPDYWN